MTNEDREHIRSMIILSDSATKKATDHVQLLNFRLTAMGPDGYTTRYMTADRAIDVCNAARLI